MKKYANVVQQVLSRMEDANIFLNTIYQTRDTFVFDREKAYGSPNINGLYWVIMDNEKLDADEFVKHELMSSATDYYNDCQYNFIIFRPHIHHN